MATTARAPKRAGKKAASRSIRKKKATARTAPARKRLSGSYNQFKDYAGQQYTGVQIGRGHHWNYDKGDWKETKITPDLWEISYAVTKRRVGRAPKGSGVPVGTGYHWYILAHQSAEKLNANDYSTTMTGLKFKLAHKRANKDKWNVSGATQRKHLVKFLKEIIAQLEKDPVPIAFELDGKQYKGEGVPISQTCSRGFCYEVDITLNDENLGIIRFAKSGWKMDLIKDKKLVASIGEAIMQWFEWPVL
jgi:hypothetical protein